MSRPGSWETEPRGKTGFDELLRRVAHDVPQRSLYVLISDFFIPLESFTRGINFLAHQGNDVLVLQTLDEAERTFPFRANTLFRGLEDNRELFVEPRRLRARYLDRLERFLSEIRRTVLRCAFDYQLLSTGEDLGPALSAVLAARARRRPAAARGSQSGAEG